MRDKIIELLKELNNEVKKDRRGGDFAGRCVASTKENIAKRINLIIESDATYQTLAK